MDKNEIQKDIERKMNAFDKIRVGKRKSVSFTDMFPLAKIYSCTTNGDKAYYKWSRLNDKLNKPDFNWSNYFEIPEPISYKSTLRVTGKEKIDVRNFKQYDQDYIETNKTEPSGYMMPVFVFINIPYSKYTDKGDAYKKSLELFELSENESIAPQKIPLLSSYRDTLLTQLERQAKEINRINIEIANVLKVYYYESDRATLKGDSGDCTEEEINKRVNDRREILRNLKNFFQIPILGGAGSDIIMASWIKKFEENNYVSPHIIESTQYGIELLSEKRDPILKMAVEIAKKITPLESILEDAFLSDRIKSKKEFQEDERYKQLPEPEYVANLFFSRKENKAGKYRPEIIKEALKIVRNYIFDKDINSISRKVRTISKEIKKVNIFNETDLKTIDKWVSFYWNEYKPTDQAQTKH